MTSPTDLKVQKLLQNLQAYSNSNAKEKLILKAYDQIQLYELTNNEAYLQQGIISWNEAIQNNPLKAHHCYSQLAKNYFSTGKFDQAVESFKKARSLAQQNQPGSIVGNAQFREIIGKIQKIQQVETEISKMQNPQIQAGFSEIADSTKQLIFNVTKSKSKPEDSDESSQIIEKMFHRIEKIEVMFTKYIDKKEERPLNKQDKKSKGKENKKEISLEKQNNDKKLLEKIMDEIKSQKKINQQLLRYIKQAKTNNPDMVLEFSLLREQFRDISFRVQVVQSKLEELIIFTRSQFDHVKSRMNNFEYQMQDFGGKIQIIKGQVQTNKKTFFYLDQIVKKQLQQKFEVNKQFDQWKKDKPQLYEYANTFSWTINDLLLSYRVASTQMFRAKDPNPSLFDKYFPLAVKGISKALQSIPGASSVIAVIGTGIQEVFQGYLQKKMQMKITKNIHIIRKYQSPQDITLDIREGVIQLCKTQYKRERLAKIINPQKEDSILQKKVQEENANLANGIKEQKISYKKALDTIDNRDGGVQLRKPEQTNEKLANIKNPKKEDSSLASKVQEIAELANGMKDNKSYQKTPIEEQAIDDVAKFMNYLLIYQIDSSETIKGMIMKFFKGDRNLQPQQVCQDCCCTIY